ncbi:MAG: hypothetical protein ACREJC_17725 [Tepidisphaeraceae bacterium]
MGAITDLWKSERGILAVAIIIAATVLAALSMMSVADWQTFVTGIFITYAGSKTVTGTVAILKGTTEPPPAPAPAPIPAPAPAPAPTAFIPNP